MPTTHQPQKMLQADTRRAAANPALTIRHSRAYLGASRGGSLCLAAPFVAVF
jgi:hypothetical protein